jgi:hypothetical protein
MKIALTLVACVSVTEQVAFAAHPAAAPPQLLKVCPAAGVAVRKTDVPLANDVLHVPLPVPPTTEQLMPLGLDTIVPFPLPLAVTLSA